MVDQRQEEVAAGGDADVAVSTVVVSFDTPGDETDRTAVAELSWGQREIWHVMQDKHTWLPIGTVLPLPPRTTVADAVDDLRFVMESYPSMRTRLRLDPDGPRQVVSADGELPLEILDVPDGGDPAEVAERTRRRYWRQPFDITTDWPLRMAVIRHRGALTHRVWVMCHLVTDGAGARIIIAELAGRDASGSRRAYSAVELARWQHSPAGLRQCEAVLGHWERILRDLPARRFPPRELAPYPRFWQAKTDSPATYLAVHALAARTGAEPSSVLLAIFAIALTRVTGVNPVAVQVVVGNRFRPRLASTVSPIMQNGLCVIDVPDTTVDEAVTRVRRRAMAAYKNAYYDPDRLAERIAQVNHDRGETVDIGCFFNDRRLRHRDVSGPPPTPEQIRAARPSSFVWQYKQDEHEFDSLFINVDDEPATVAMTVLADIHQIAASDVEACVHGMEEIAVAAALEPATRALAPAGGGAR